ncbi:hypothetical protein ABZT48_04280 [Streptomyces avermitilis]
MVVTYVVVTLLTSAVNGYHWAHSWRRARWGCRPVLSCRCWARSPPVVSCCTSSVRYRAHARVRDRQLGPWAVFFCLAAACLAVNLACHGPW